jgi:hypothetical protein
MYKNSVHTSQETHYVSATKTNRLILFRKTITFYFENCTKHTNTLCYIVLEHVVNIEPLGFKWLIVT